MSILYQDHFGLHKQPFQITPDTDYFFSGSRRGDLLAALLHVAGHDEGIVTVVAEVGSGKTLLARLLITNLPPDISTVYLANPCFSRDEIIGAIGRDLGLTNLPASIEEKLAALHQELLRRHANGERVLLVIDEAHAMPAESLEEVRLLSNLETGHHKLVNIMLFGQPELDALLAEPRLRQVRDRVIHRFELPPFTREDGAAYLDHRLRVAGWRGGRVFSDGALSVLMKASGGRARRINLLADKALLSAYAENLKQVDKRHAKTACKEFEVPRLKLMKSASTAQEAHGGMPWLQIFLMSLAISIIMAAAAMLLLGGDRLFSQLQPKLNTLPGTPLSESTPAPHGVPGLQTAQLAEPSHIVDQAKETSPDRLPIP
jgi:type II secretory pathway predicted ATPase ExeA